MAAGIAIIGVLILALVAAVGLFAAPFLQGQYKDVPERPIEQRHKTNIGED